MSLMMMKPFDYFRDKVILAPGYPWQLMFMHSVSAIVSWREYDEAHPIVDNKRKYKIFYDIIASYFCHGFGGTSMRDWTMGEPSSLYRQVQIPQTWLLAYSMVYYCPYDVLYNLCTKRHSPVQIVVHVYEAVDIATTICGSIEKANELFPGNYNAQIISAMVSGMGGSLFRYFERKYSRQQANIETELYAPSMAVRRTFTYIVLYMIIRQAVGATKARLYVTLLHITWSLIKEAKGSSIEQIGWLDYDFFR